MQIPIPSTLLKMGSITLLVVCSVFITVNAQPVSVINLDSCQAMALRHYPMIKQYDLIEKSKAYTINNVGRNNRPQIMIAGQATYQSDVTGIPVAGMEIEPLSKDQYKFYAEVSQSITDLFVRDDQETLISAQAEVEKQKTNVELYQLRDRINQLYFGILLLDEQLKQIHILQKDIHAGLDKARVAVDNGIALRSSVDILQAELLNQDQRIVEINASKKAYTNLLAVFTDAAIDESTTLETPSSPEPNLMIERPEMGLYAAQKNALSLQSENLSIRNLPRASVFLQGGVGRPALDFLNNSFDGYYIGGLRFSWNLNSYNTFKNEKSLLQLQESAVDVQQETFLFNTELKTKHQFTDIEKFKELIRTDESIITLRESIVSSTKNQLEFGTATSNDYITAANAADQARQNMALHQTQLLSAIYQLNYTTGH